MNEPSELEPRAARKVDGDASERPRASRDGRAHGLNEGVDWIHSRADLQAIAGLDRRLVVAENGGPKAAAFTFDAEGQVPQALVKRCVLAGHLVTNHAAEDHAHFLGRVPPGLNAQLTLVLPMRLANGAHLSLTPLRAASAFLEEQPISQVQLQRRAPLDLTRVADAGSFARLVGDADEPKPVRGRVRLPGRKAFLVLEER